MGKSWPCSDARTPHLSDNNKGRLRARISQQIYTPGRLKGPAGESKWTDAAFVVAIMVGSFGRSAQPGIPARLGQPFYLVAAVHAAIGSCALLFGAFVALRGNELVPRLLAFRNYKLWMRSAYGLYMLATALGVWVYVTWYAAAQPETAQAAATQPEEPSTRSIPMANFVFNPAELVIPAGTTVEWANQDGAPHTATSDDGVLFRSATLGNGERFGFHFDTPGEYAYYCELHGSAGGIGMAGTIRVVAPDDAPQLAGKPPATATPVGGDTPTPLPLPHELFEQPAGTAAFRDQLAYGDALELDLLLGATAPQEPLAVFLVSVDGDSVLPLGAILSDGVRAKLQYIAPGGERLAGSYSRLLVTTDAASVARPAGRTVFEATLPLLAFGQLGRLLGEHARAPGYAVMLRQQADELARHIVLLAESQAAGDVGGMRRHGEHVFNLVAGSRDARFGDLDGDGKSQNPGDGFGLLPNGQQDGYIKGMVDHARLAAESPDATENIKLHAGHVGIAGENTRVRVAQIGDIARRVLQAAGVADTQNDVLSIVALAQQTIGGVDTNNDEQIAPAPGEGGVLTAYQHAQLMAGITLTAEAAAQIAAPPAAVAPNAAAQQIAIDIVDNSFTAAKISVPVGASVVWANTGQKKHTVTADDGSFESGELVNGASFAHTFDTPGTYQYFCAFHGGAGGQGMAATIVVVDAAAAAPATASAQPADQSHAPAEVKPSAPPVQSAAASPAPAAAAGRVDVSIGDNSFTPREISVPLGTTISWSHDGQRPHTVTGDDGSFNSQTLQNGGTFERTFDAPGVYAYYCEFHGGPGGVGMSGVIRVEDR